MNLVLSLFPGLELLDRAFREAGFCVVAGPDRLFGEDVRDFTPPPGAFDGVIGGTPCQAFSKLANLVRANGYEPKFGNLIPEYERVVEAAEPRWFLHENVPQAPAPRPAGYEVEHFVLCNSWIPDDLGIGQEQERERRFTFGLRGTAPAPDLRRWIPLAAERLPPAERTQAVVSDSRAVPVAVGGSGKVKRTRQPTVTGAHTCHRRPKGGHGETRSVPEMLRLQGLPEDMMKDAPFTVVAQRKLIANGVPMPLGRAIARAVLGALRSES